MAIHVVVVPSTQLERWDAKFYLQEDWTWPVGAIQPFGAVADRRTEPLSAGSVVPLGSIHFDGSISVRPAAPAAPKGQLFVAHENDLVFSKIDARNGAIAVIPPGTGALCFSAEFPIYDLATKGRMRPAFMQLLCRTRALKDKINATVVGHSGRKRLSADLFEQLSIPAPEPHVQDLILASLSADLAEAGACDAAATACEESLNRAILEILEIPYVAFVPHGRPFVVESASIGSWSVRSAMRAAMGISEVPLSKYTVVLLGAPDISDVSYGIAKSPRNRPGDNARPYLRVANVQSDHLDLREMKYIDVPPRSGGPL